MNPLPVDAVSPAATDEPLQFIAGPLKVLPPPYPHQNEPLSVGQTVGIEVFGRRFRGGQGWWALVCEAKQNECSLHSTRLSTSPVRLPPGPYDEGPPKRGQRLLWSPLPHGLDRVPSKDQVVSQSPQVVAVFKVLRPAVLPKLKEGRVETWWRVQRREKFGERSEENRINSRLATLEVALDGLRESSTMLVPRLASRGETHIEALELRDRGRRQALPGYVFYAEEGDPEVQNFSLEPGNFLRWAGDLDGDGQVDLILSHGNGPEAETVLYLSSAAIKDDAEAVTDGLIRPGELQSDKSRALEAGPLVGRVGGFSIVLR